jgi:Tfp pilus assembly protein PilN
VTAAIQTGGRVAPGAPTPAVAHLASLPSINLMPPEIAEQAALRQMKMVCAGIAALCLLIVGGLYYQAHSSVSSANKNLASAQQQQATVQAQVSKLQPVAQAYAQVASAKALVTEALTGKIEWSQQLNDLALTTPSGVWLTNMTVTAGSTDSSGSVGGTNAATASSNAALTGQGIATITFTGVASEQGATGLNGARDVVANWLDALATEHGYTNPYVSTTQEALIGNTPVVNFSSTVTVTSALLAPAPFTNSGS